MGKFLEGIYLQLQSVTWIYERVEETIAKTQILRENPI